MSKRREKRIIELLEQILESLNSIDAGVHNQ